MIEIEKMMLAKLRKGLALAICLLWLPVLVTAADKPIAIFPLQELGEGRNDANLFFTELLAEHLANLGNEVIGTETTIAFMAVNRIRTLGHLDAFQIMRTQEDLGAAFVLLGTVSQRKELPEPSLGLVLNLVRASDAKTVWSYTGSFSTGEERRILGLGEPRSVEQLQPFVLDEIAEFWPWDIINAVQMTNAINLETATLTPEQVSPGGEVEGRVRLRNSWSKGSAPSIFFKVDDQLYPATAAEDGLTYQATWVAGEKDGRFQVFLRLEWPEYKRIESVLLGNFLIDGTPPLFEIDLPGTTVVNDLPISLGDLKIRPQMIVRKPLSHWRLAFYSEMDGFIGEMTDHGNMPKSFLWKGRGEGVGGNAGDGVYEVVLEAWDKAGNYAKDSKKVMMKRIKSDLKMVMDRSDQKISVELENPEKIPLRYWRLEMWTKEGKMLTKSEGKDLPAKLEVDLLSSEQQQIEGFLTFQDELGKKVFKKFQQSPKVSSESKSDKEEPKGISEKWVDEF